MFLSKLVLDGKNRAVQRDISDIYLLHQSLARGFIGQTPGRILFRVENLNGRIIVLVQSQIRPEWSNLDPSYVLAKPLFKEINPAFHPGQMMMFRLRANPTVKRDGRREGLLNEEHQLAWLSRKGKDHGFDVVSAFSHGQRLDIGNRGKDNEIRLFTVQFDGVLEVKDAEMIRKAVEDGIGSAKGFGNGLLSLAMRP